jgi:hypothetical protein
LIKAPLSTDSRCSPIGWVVIECGPRVTAFYSKAG